MKITIIKRKQSLKVQFTQNGNSVIYSPSLMLSRRKKESHIDL